MTEAKVDLTSPICHEEDATRAYLESVLWPDGPHCPPCGIMGDRITKLRKSTCPGVYKCNHRKSLGFDDVARAGNPVARRQG